MKLVYILSAYKYPEQLVRLIDRLHSDSASFFVHVDKKTASDVYDQMVNGTQHLPDVYFIKRHRCDWGDFGHVRATLEGIDEIFQQNICFDYAILLTGQDYPIKSEDQIKEFLLRNEGKSFIDYLPLPSKNWEYGGMKRIERWHMRFLNRHFVFPKNGSWIKRKFPEGFRPYAGSSYWCLTKACIEYIYQFTRKNPGFVRYFNTVDVPDEIFFQTILMNSPHSASIVNDDLRYIEWKDPDSGSPSVLVSCDFEKIASSSKLFARKFDMNVDAQVLDLIDQEIIKYSGEK